MDFPCNFVEQAADTTALVTNQQKPRNTSSIRFGEIATRMRTSKPTRTAPTKERATRDTTQHNYLGAHDDTPPSANCWVSNMRGRPHALINRVAQKQIHMTAAAQSQQPAAQTRQDSGNHSRPKPLGHATELSLLGGNHVQTKRGNLDARPQGATAKILVGTDRRMRIPKTNFTLTNFGLHGLGT